MSGYYQQLFPAALMTIGLALTALAFGLVLAVSIAGMERSRLKFVAVPIKTIMMLLRGLPELLVVLFIYFGSTQVLFLITGSYVEFQPFWCGVMALSLIFAAYASQTLRGAFNAVPVGQWESGIALSLPKHVIFFRLILPQVWRHALPGLGAQWLVLLKDTALVSLIGVNDLMWQAQLASSATFLPFTWFAMAALIYLVISICSQWCLKRIESRVTHFERAIS